MTRAEVAHRLGRTLEHAAVTRQRADVDRVDRARASRAGEPASRRQVQGGGRDGLERCDEQASLPRRVNHRRIVARIAGGEVARVRDEHQVRVRRRQDRAKIVGVLDAQILRDRSGFALFRAARADEFEPGGVGDGGDERHLPRVQPGDRASVHGRASYRLDLSGAARRPHAGRESPV